MPAQTQPVASRIPATVLLAIALLLGIGVAIGGYLAGRGVILARLADRFVTVKGVAEIDARANLAIYPVSFVVTTDDLAAGKRASTSRSPRPARSSPAAASPTATSRPRASRSATASPTAIAPRARARPRAMC